jgi:hypothetical protein
VSLPVVPEIKSSPELPRILRGISILLIVTGVMDMATPLGAFLQADASVHNW